MRNEEDGYGMMPLHLLTDKFEETDMYEDPNDLISYQRTTLADFSTDKPAFESDAPRKRKHSEEFFNLRTCGARSAELPYLPDGTFLDYEFMIPDSRGPDGLPNFRKMLDQQKYRLQQVNFGKDSDNTVSDGPISAASMRDRIRNEQSRIGAALKYNFYDSVEGTQSYSALPTKNIRWENAVHDHVLKPGFESQSLARDPSGCKNNPASYQGHYSVHDHEMGLLNINHVRQYAPASQISQLKTSTRDGKVKKEMAEASVRSAMARINDEAARERNLRTSGPLPGKGSTESVVRLQAIVAQQLRIIEAAKCSQSATHQRETTNKIGSSKSNNRALLDATHINHSIVESMANVMRYNGNQSRKDLRDALHETAKRSSIDIASSNKQASTARLSDLRQHTADERIIHEQKTPKMYLGLRQARAGVRLTKQELYGDKSKEQTNKESLQKSESIVREGVAVQSFGNVQESRMPAMNKSSSGIRGDLIIEDREPEREAGIW